MPVFFVMAPRGRKSNPLHCSRSLRSAVALTSDIGVAAQHLICVYTDTQRPAASTRIPEKETGLECRFFSLWQRYTHAMRILTSVLIFCLLLLPLGGKAGTLLLAPGLTGEGGATANVGVGLDWNRRWFESDTGHLGGYWHAGYTWWEGGRAGDAAHMVSISPVLVYAFNADNWRPFIELGVGAALFSRQRVGDKNLGSSAHFEDRLGAGLFIGERDRLMLRVIHYSNAGLSRPNPGIESYSLVWARSF